MKNYKRWLAIFAAMALLLCFTGCGANTNADTNADTSADTSLSLTMGTGGSAGTYFSFGNVLAGYMAEKSGASVNVVSTGGSADNIYNIDDGINHLATVQSDVMSYAWDGIKSFEADGKIDSFRVIGGLYEETVQIVTLRDDIKSVADLKGKAVSIGAPGSGVYFNAMDILGIYGIAETDIKAEYLSFGDSTDAMKDGKIDAAFIVAGAPTPAITDLSATNKVYLVSMEDDKVDALMADSPFYTKSVLSADTYDMADSANTVSVKATMIVAADVADDVVYDLTDGIFDNASAITAAHAKGAELNLENAVSGMTVPFHPGAARYFAEKGIDVAK